MKKLLVVLFGIIGLIFISSNISNVVFDGMYQPQIGAGLTAVSFAVGKLIPAGSFGMAIPIIDARALFTKSIVDVYSDDMPVTSFLSSFFPNKETMSKEISIAVERNKELVAVDVSRYSDGNRNTFDLQTEKVILPPIYDEFFNVNEHKLYDVVIQNIAEGNMTFFKELTEAQARQLVRLRNKILRSVELQCAQVLETGVVQLAQNTDIDFQRRAASLVDPGAGNYWATGTVSPYVDMEAAATFLRTFGKAQGTFFNVLMGDEVYQDFLKNDIVKARADVRRFSMDELNMPQKIETGGVFQGEVACGAYKIRIWTYPSFYDTEGVLHNSFLNSKKFVMIPENPRFFTGWAAVPQLINSNGTVPQQGAFLIKDFIDAKETAHEQHIMAAPIAVPTAIDQIFTFKAVAG